MISLQRGRSERTSCPPWSSGRLQLCFAGTWSLRMGGIVAGMSRQGAKGRAYLAAGRAGQRHGGIKEQGRCRGHLTSLL